MLLLILATFLDLFATVFNGLIIGRIVLGLFTAPTNRLFLALVNLTEPLLGPVRRVLPASGGLDFSPTVTVILLYLVDMFVQGLLKQA